MLQCGMAKRSAALVVITQASKRLRGGRQRASGHRAMSLAAQGRMELGAGAYINISKGLIPDSTAVFQQLQVVARCGGVSFACTVGLSTLITPHTAPAFSLPASAGDSAMVAPRDRSHGTARAAAPLDCLYG